jgi:hypothetical protein
MFAEIYANGSTTQRDVDLSSTVRNVAGDTVFRAREERVTNGFTDAYRVEVPLQGLDPGAYVLTVEARDDVESPPVGRDVAFTVFR